ncbi:terminase large subunit domain-containing protein [Sphingopyxis sp. JAI108]|uniref:DNA-packaging protein n=1 Tax=Sphingopyxis sp. JAI108 TaxID=2723060 RepID=UPI0015CC0219|nr:phage terminase large subunit-like protein [Sphingopyxis sp. JAI108]
MKGLSELLRLAPEEFAAWARRVNDTSAERLLGDWSWWRRADQCPPQGDWHVWMLLAGRGFGKTRAGAEWVRGYAEAHPGARIALVAASLHEARQVMVEGESGLLSIAPDDVRPEYESSLRRLSWANGAVATLYSAAEPESLRGPEHSAAWCDEIAKWPQGEAAWDNLMLTMRIGDNPRVVATTTPRGVPLVRRLMKEKGVETTGGSTGDNCLNLSPQWLATMDAIYGGTRLGRQELRGELLEDVEGALWTRALVERCRVEAASVGKPMRVVIGVDPPATANGDACGIVVAAQLRDERLAVVEDASVENPPPHVWAQAVAAAAARWGADRVVAESNMGGEMVEGTLRQADVALPVVPVHASIGKARRAEPVALAYERGDVVHAGVFESLEDQLCGLQVGGGYAGPGRSPDRADACVWALAALQEGLRKGRGPGVRRV